MSNERPEPVERNALIEALDAAQRLVTGQSVLLSSMLADLLGMHSTDLEALGILYDEGAVTAGRLAEVTGLTTGAVTRMIDRLERSGYVRREPDPRDRRRVIVRPIAEKIEALAVYYRPIQEAAHQTYAAYSDDELMLILDFLRRAHQVGVAEATRLKNQAPGSRRSSPNSSA